MSNKTTQSCLSNTSAMQNGNKFHSGEQLWFWFLYSKSARAGRGFGAAPESRRVCELLDVETLITKLYLSGKLSGEQLEVMKKFGDKRRTPHQHIWSENHAAGLWRDAMQTIEAAAVKKGWVE